MNHEGAGRRALRRGIEVSGALLRLVTGAAAAAMLAIGIFRKRKKKTR